MTLRIRASIPLAFAAAIAASAVQDDAPPIDWIRKNAIPLTGVQAGGGRDDLSPLRKLIGDARIVSLASSFLPWTWVSPSSPSKPICRRRTA